MQKTKLIVSIEVFTYLNKKTIKYTTTLTNKFVHVTKNITKLSDETFGVHNGYTK